MRRLLIIPAAGAGSRLGGDVPKILVPVAGSPMVALLLSLYRPWIDSTVVIAHPTFSETVRAYLHRANDAIPGGGMHVAVTEQTSRTGMLDAVLLAAPAVERQAPDEVWITWGDQVGVLPATVERLANAMGANPPPRMALPTVRGRDPYTHFERDASGRITGLLHRREGDRMPADGESDMGLFAMTRETYERDLRAYAEAVRPGETTGERNFLPFVPWLAARATVTTIPCSDPREAIGVNTPDDLVVVEQWLGSRPA